jgi:predicted oxidoreductase
MDQGKAKRVSRRDFVRNVGLGVAGAGALPALNLQAQQTQPTGAPSQWDLEADVVVIGSGATGLPAAIRARDAGASVIVVEANYEIGGHGLLNGGQVPLGGGTSHQKKHGVEDSPDLLFKDLTDWTVVETNGMPDYRFNDRGVQRALANNEAQAFEFLLENGVVFSDEPPGVGGGHAVGLSAPRMHYAIWDKGQSWESPRGGGGTTIYRALENSAKLKGVKFLLNYHMDTIYREGSSSGRILGLKASYTPKFLPGSTTPMKPFRSDGLIELSGPTVAVKAKRAVIIASGGNSGNVNIRRIFDPRLTETYQLAGEPFSSQDGSGEMAAMAIGASLWGTANQSLERNGAVRKRDLIGAQYLYVGWTPESPVFPLARATGLRVRDWQTLIIVNQVGKRFYDETSGNWPYGTHFGDIKGYVQGDWRNARKRPIVPQNFIDAALAPNEGSQPPDFGAGPTWAIFDAEAVKREDWELTAPYVDPLFFFSGTTLAELAAQIKKNPLTKVEMPAKNLEETVARWNRMIDTGQDTDFESPSPRYKIETAPFYAAWATVEVHDTYAGLRINMKCQVMDMQGQVIPGLYCGGESAGGCSQHGQGRCITQGYIAGHEAAKETPWS